jgi:hypothetical protein
MARTFDELEKEVDELRRLVEELQRRTEVIASRTVNREIGSRDRPLDFVYVRAGKLNGAVAKLDFDSTGAGDGVVRVKKVK